VDDVERAPSPALSDSDRATIARAPRAASIEMVVFALERTKDVPGAVSRDVIDRVDAVAELGHVPDRLLDEDVLVADEHDADDLRAHRR